MRVGQAGYLGICVSGCASCEFSPSHLGLIANVKKWRSAAIVIALLPLSRTLRDPHKNLGVHVGILAGLVVCDTVGKIGTMPDMEELSGLVIVPQGREGETELEARAVEKASREMPLEDLDVDRMDRSACFALICLLGTECAWLADESDGNEIPVVGQTMTKKQEWAISCSCS